MKTFGDNINKYTKLQKNQADSFLDKKVQRRFDLMKELALKGYIEINMIQNKGKNVIACSKYSI